VGILSLDAGSALAQEVPLGHRLLGTLGLGAGRVLVDRNGHVVPVGLRLRVLDAQTGISGTFKLRPLHARYTLALGVPAGVVRVNVSGALLQGSASGVGDIFVMPFGLGWSLSRVDVLFDYAFYVPTARFEPGSRRNTSQAQWTHEWSVGGNVAFDARRRWQLSLLGSYDFNQTKIGIDIRRGSTLQIQGGFGATIARILEVGAVGAALWQLTLDRGSALPAQLAGAREQAVSVGGEVGR
jgi:hypothetical protein